MFNLKHKQIYIFELAKIGGLLFYLLFSILGWLMNLGKSNSFKDMFMSNFTHFISGYFAITLLFLIFNYQIKNKSISKLLFILLLLPSCYASSFVWLFLSDSFNLLLNSDELLFSSILFLKAFSYLIIVVPFAALYFLIDHWLNLKKQKEMTLVATNLANEAQLQMLRYQINPHFLFNALNTIRSMVEEDKTIARNMITELSNFFRYSLSQNGTTDTLENEINAIKNYLAIQKTRFEEKLIFSFDINEDLYQMKIPFYIILPLVENAIKFGLQSSPIPLNIKIIAKANEHLEISVHNTGKIIENNKSIDGTKTGVENTKKRLALYFSDNYSFKLFEKDSWVIAQIIIKDFRNQLAE